MNGEHQHLDELAIVEYALDGMEGSQRLEAEAHLKVCPPCRAMVGEAMQLHDGFAGLAAEAPMPQGLAESILKRVRQVGR